MYLKQDSCYAFPLFHRNYLHSKSGENLEMTNPHSVVSNSVFQDLGDVGKKISIMVLVSDTELVLVSPGLPCLVNIFTG